MKLYRVYQEVNNDYDTWDSAVVAAETEQEAIDIMEKYTRHERDDPYPSWCNKEYVKVDYIGDSTPSIKAGVIVDSFNAG